MNSAANAINNRYTKFENEECSRNAHKHVKRMESHSGSALDRFAMVVPIVVLEQNIEHSRTPRLGASRPLFLTIFTLLTIKDGKDLELKAATASEGVQYEGHRRELREIAPFVAKDGQVVVNVNHEYQGFRAGAVGAVPCGHGGSSALPLIARARGTEGQGSILLL